MKRIFLLTLAFSLWVSPLQALSPLRLVVLIDMSASMDNRTPPFTAEHFDYLIQMIKGRGGEIAVGGIADSSEEPFCRLRLEIPPVAPKRPQGVNKGASPFEQRAALKDYKRAQAYYERRLAYYTKITKQRSEQFRSEIATFLKRPRNAKTSNLTQALVRGCIVLGEPVAGYRRAPVNIVLIHSDGQHVSHTTIAPEAASVPLPANSQILLVNGTSSLASLTYLQGQNLRHFEALQPALTYVAHNRD